MVKKKLLFYIIFLSLFIFLIKWAIDSPLRSASISVANDTTNNLLVAPTQVSETESNEWPVDISVEDDTGQSLGGAHVTVRGTSDSTLVTKQTGTDGFVSFDLSCPGEYTITIRHEECFSPLPLNVVIAREKERSWRFTLNKKRAIAGIIVAGTNTPLNNACVNIVEAPKPDFSFSLPDMIRSSTDGHFCLKPLVAGDYLLSVSHPDFLLHEVRCQAGCQDLVIQLRKTYKVEILVVNDSNEPVGGADVQLQSGVAKGWTAFDGRTNVHGKIDFEVLFPGQYSIRAVAPLSKISAATDITIASVDTVRVTLTFPSNRFSLSGKVLDAVSSSGIGNATVICERTAAGQNIHGRQTCLTGSDGSFRFPDLVSGRYSLWVDEYEGYQSGNYRSHGMLGAYPPKLFSHFVEGDVDDIVLWLKPAWRISGRVYDENDRPLADAVLTLQLLFQPETGAGFQGFRPIGTSALTGDDGRYELVGSFDYEKRSSRVLVKVNHPAYGQLISDTFQPEPGECIESIDFHFQRGSNVYGSVLTEEGNPVGNATILIYQRNPSFNLPIAQGRSMEDGSFVLAVEPGIYSAHAEADGFTDITRNNLQQLTVPETGRIRIDFMMLPSDSNGIEGIVMNSKGLPLADIDIYLYPYSKQREDLPDSIVGEKKDRTDEQGRFSISLQTGVVPINDPVYKITAIPASSSHYTSHSIDRVKPGEKDIEIILEETEDRSFEINGLVIDAQGQPVTNYHLLPIPGMNNQFDHRLMADSGLYRWQPVFSPEGRFRIKGNNSNEGPFCIAARTEDDGIAMSEVIDIEPLEVRNDVIIQLNPKVTYRGRITNKETGEAVPGSQVSLLVMTDKLNQMERLMGIGYARMIASNRGMAEQAPIQWFIPKTRSDENGMFVLADVPNIPCWLVVLGNNCRPFFLSVPSPSEGGFIDLGEIALEPFGSGIEGRAPTIKIGL